MEFFTPVCPLLSNLFHLKSFLPDLLNNSEFIPDLAMYSSQLWLGAQFKGFPGSPPPGPPSPGRLFKLLKIITKNILRFIFILPFILIFKSIYTCWHFDIWTISYFSQVFISHIPFIGSYLFYLLNEQGSQLSYNLGGVASLPEINQYIGNLIFSGGLGTSFGTALLEFFFDKDKLPIVGNFPDETLINSHGGVPSSRPGLEIKKPPISIMQADNIGEAGILKSSQVTAYSPPSGGVSNKVYSLEPLDKLIAERNKLLSDTRKLIEDNSSSPSKVPAASPSPSAPTNNKNTVETLIHLTQTHIKHNKAMEQFVNTHYSFLSTEFFNKEIKPLVDEVDKLWNELFSDLSKMSSDKPFFCKRRFDLENRTFKKEAGIFLEIEKKLFEEVANQAKQGRLPEGFLADYKKDIQKAWIREREFYSGEERKLKKEVAKSFEKKA